MIPNPPKTPLNPQTGGQGGRRAGGDSRDEGTPGVSKGKSGGTWGKEEGGTLTGSRSGVTQVTGQ